MTKSTLSMLLAAMLATSGFALAQSNANRPVPPQGGSTMVPPAVDAGTNPNTRAGVKSEIDTRSRAGAPAQGGNMTSGASTGGAPTPSDASAASRADVKAQISNDSKAGGPPQGSNTVSGAPPSHATATTAAERKAARAQRKAERKARREAAAANTTGKGMNTGPSSPAKTAPQ